MKNMLALTRILSPFALLSFFSSAALAQSPVRAKKLIEYGWDTPDATYVRQHIREMEKLPFDGLIFHLAGWPKSAEVFTKEPWDETKFAASLDDCKKIQWDKFTDNFLIMLAASNMDWFSDADWTAVRHNVGIVTRAAAQARCRGICFDAEPYGKNPWHYPEQAHGKDKSFAEYQTKVRQRGAEFMRTVAAQMPKAVVHTFFLLSYIGEALDEPDPAKRDRLLAVHDYGLLPAFLNGMLDAAGPDITITDGNEGSYYYTQPLQHYQAYHRLKQRGLSLIGTENARKYQSQVQVSQALYVDYVFGLGRWAQESSPAPMLTAEERQHWFEHNTYYDLTTADEFVWLYSEKMDWWKHAGLPPGLEQAVQSARAKIANRQPLGFEMADVLKAAQERRQAGLQARLIRRTADIPRLAAGERPPIIDGTLDEPVWQKAVLLEPFVPYVTVTTTPAAPTRAHVTYDPQNLYVAVECAEPKPDKMQIIGDTHDAAIWEGDSLDILLSQTQNPVPYVHLILNPHGVQWDALHTTQDDLAFDPHWQSAIHKEKNQWTAEVAIPWSEIKMQPPAPGATLHANICRQRKPDSEQTSWSQMIEGFLEAGNFGTWVFR